MKVFQILLKSLITFNSGKYYLRDTTLIKRAYTTTISKYTTSINYKFNQQYNYLIDGKKILKPSNFESQHFSLTNIILRCYSSLFSGTINLPTRNLSSKHKEPDQRVNNIIDK